MSKEGDRKNFLDSMVSEALRKMYSKETNDVKMVSKGHGLELTGYALVDDDHRYIDIRISITKDH